MPYHIVIPLYGFPRSITEDVAFGGGFILGALPEWVRTESMLENLNRHQRRDVENADVAFRARYEAAALGDPDPEWTGDQPRAIQESKYDAGVLANLALWLARPSPVGFTAVIHAPEREPSPVAQRISTHSQLLCHPRDVNAQVTAEDVELASRLHTNLLSIRRGTALWTVVRSMWAGLQLNEEAIRCVLFWVALEAMFGPEDGREITYRISQRVGLFLGEDPERARELFQTAKRGYRYRSKIVHGKWNQDPQGIDRMAEAEEMARLSLSKILQDDALMKVFLGADREEFLDGLAFLGR